MPTISALSTLSLGQIDSSLFFYPLRATATDPTNASWRANNLGYRFVPNEGIYTIGPITNASNMFRGNTTFNDPDISTWETNTFTNMSGMFFNCSVFNQSVSNFNTYNVTLMNSMFDSCFTFNQPVSNFVTNRVTSMRFMFFNCDVFNQSVANFNTANVTDMEGMFQSCNVFNQSVANFVTNRVTSMRFMFQGCANFNQDISSWNVSNVTNMEGMFQSNFSFNCGQASGFAHDLMQRTASGGWRTNSVTVNGMNNMFQNAQSFNGNISAWCVSNIATSPSGFAQGANPNFTTARQPTWGTCPIP